MKTLEQSDVDRAVASAKETLRENEHLRWITSSSLLERVYLFGLYAGLDALTGEGALRRFIIEMMSDTLFQREGDDLFSLTKIGRLYLSMKDRFRGDEHVLLADTLAQFQYQIEERDHRWQMNVRETKKLLLACRDVDTQIKEAEGSSEDRDHYRSLYGERHRLYDKLEHHLRVVALLDIDHHWKKVMDEKMPSSY